MTYVYKNPKVHDANQVSDFIDMGDINRAIDGVIGLSLYNDDRTAVKKFIFKLLSYKTTNTQFQYALIKALSNIARIDRNITKSDVKIIINMFQDNDLLQGALSDFIDDYNVFCKIHKSTE